MQGTIQRVHTRYTLHSYYFMHDVRKPITRKNRKVHKDVYYGEQTTVFQNGLRISFTNFIPDYANDTLLLKYDSMGNLVYLYKYENGYQCVSPIKEEWFLHYDSLNRLVYVEWWKLAYSKGLPIRMHAFLYDEDRCIARVNDMPTGIPKGDLRQLHYETMPDGSVKLHVTRCDEDQGSDSVRNQGVAGSNPVFSTKKTLIVDNQWLKFFLYTPISSRTAAVRKRVSTTSLVMVSRRLGA